MLQSCYLTCWSQWYDNLCWGHNSCHTNNTYLYLWYRSVVWWNLWFLYIYTYKRKWYSIHKWRFHLPWHFHHFENRWFRSCYWTWFAIFNKTCCILDQLQKLTLRFDRNIRCIHTWLYSYRNYCSYCSYSSNLHSFGYCTFNYIWSICSWKLWLVYINLSLWNLQWINSSRIQWYNSSKLCFKLASFN